MTDQAAQARALREQSERLLSNEPLPPPPAAPPTRALRPGEEVLGAADWDLIDSEPEYRREALRRSILAERQREAQARPHPAAGQEYESAARKVLARWLRGFLRANGAFVTSKTLDVLLPKMGDSVARSFEQRDARLAALEARLAATEGRVAALEGRRAEADR